MGAKSVIVTASEVTAALLLKHGFADIGGESVVFSDRPRVPFRPLQLNF